MNACVLEPEGRASGARDCYRFRGARGTHAWPTRHGERLGMCGMWNFLWRLGVRPGVARIESLPDPAEAILWVSLEEAEDPDRLQRLRRYVSHGGFVVAAGNARAAAVVFGRQADTWSSRQIDHPYAGLAAIMPGAAPELLAPAGWHVSVCSEPDAGHVGVLVAVQGERQTPARATLVPIDGAPAIVAGARGCFVNGDPFAAFQSWLQGQDDLQPWLGWRSRLFWLDEWVSTIAAVLSRFGALPESMPRPGIGGLGARTVVLRHDVDHSRDLSYLREEAARGIPGTHAVLRDPNTAFWRDAVAQHADHEVAFHYTTSARDWIGAARARLTGRRIASSRPARSAIVGDGLLRQVRWAMAHGVGTATLHRHASFMIYPEWIDALHEVFERETRVRGGSSLFRGHVFRWGVESVDGMHGSLGEWPDAQFPAWLPFKLAHAARGGQRLRGWETTSVMESEPELVDQLLSYRTPLLPQRVITLGYHPAHAVGTTFHGRGSLGDFRRVLDVVMDHGVQVETLQRVYALADAAVGEHVHSASSGAA